MLRLIRWLRRKVQSNARVKLSERESKIMRRLHAGAMLRSQRDIDGQKQYWLCAPDFSNPQAVRPDDVHRLREMRLIETNHKFPTATYLLTQKGAAVARQHAADPASAALTARRFATSDD